MPIIFRNNPIPTSGALYVTNPGMPRRENGKMYRFIFEELFGRRGSSGKKSADQTLIRNMLFKGQGGTAAQRKKAQKMREQILSKKGAVYKKYLKYRTSATKAYKRVLDEAAKGKGKKTKSKKGKGKTGVVKAKNGRKMHYVNGKLVSAADYKKLTGKSSRASKQKQTGKKSRASAQKSTGMTWQQLVKKHGVQKASKLYKKRKKNPRSTPLRKNSAKERYIYYKFQGLSEFPGQLTLQQETLVRGLLKPRSKGGIGTPEERALAKRFQSEWTSRTPTQEVKELKEMVSGRRQQVAQRRYRFASMSADERREYNRTHGARQRGSGSRAGRQSVSEDSRFASLFPRTAERSQRASSQAQTGGILSGLTKPQKKQVTLIFFDAENKRDFAKQIVAEGIDIDPLALGILYTEIDKLYKNNPKRRNPMAKKKSLKTGNWKGRMMKYTTFTKRLKGCGLTGAMKSKMWARYKATGKLPPLARAKSRAATQKKSGTAASGLSSWQKLVKKHGVVKASKLYKKQKSKSTTKKSSSKKSGSSQKTKVGQQIQKLRREAGMRKIDLRGPKYDTLAKRRAALKDLKDKLAGKAPKKSTRKTTSKKTSSRARRPSALTQGEKYKLYLAQRRKMSRLKKGESFTKAEYTSIQRAWKKDQPKIEKLCESTRKSFRTCVREYVRDIYGEFTPMRGKLKQLGRKGRQMKAAGVSGVLSPGFGTSATVMLDVEDTKARREFFENAAEQGLEEDEAMVLWKEITKKPRRSAPSAASKRAFIQKAMGQGLFEEEAEALWKETIRMNPRRNPGHMSMDMFMGAQGAGLSTPFAFLGDVIEDIKGYVSEIPIVDMATPYVAPVLLGGVVAGVHYAGGRYLGPKLQQIKSLQRLDKVGYTLVGVSTALAIKLGQHFGLFESAEADQVAQLAVLTGAFVDGLDYFRGNSATNTPIAGIAMSGYGDGGQYFLAPMSQGTQAPLRRHMKQIAPQASDYQGVVAPLSGAADTAGAATGYGALMYTGAGY